MMTQSLHFRASQEVIEALDKRASEEGRTRANMLEYLVRDALGIGRVQVVVKAPGKGSELAAKAVEKKIASGVGPRDMCPHGREYRHCTLAICREALNGV